MEAVVNPWQMQICRSSSSFLVPPTWNEGDHVRKFGLSGKPLPRKLADKKKFSAPEITTSVIVDLALENLRTEHISIELKASRDIPTHDAKF